MLVMHLGQLATNVLRGRRFQSVEHSSHFSYLYSFIFHYISEERTLENALKKEKERERGWGSLKPSLSLFSSSSSFSESNERAGRFSKQTQTRH